MDSRVAIYYGSERIALDLPPKGVKVEMNLQVKPATEIGSSTGSHSKTFTIPASAFNLETLGFPNDPGSYLTYSRELVEIYVLSRDEVVLAGNGRATLFEAVEGRDRDIELIIYGSNLVWISETQETSLRETTNLGNFTMSRGNVEDSWDAADAYDDHNGTRWFPVNYGAWKVENFIPVSDLRPHINVAHLLETIFKQHGYSITGDWISNTETRKLYWLFTDKGAWLQDPDWADDHEFTAQRSSDQTVPTGGSGTVTIRVEYNFDGTGSLDPSDFWDTSTYEGEFVDAMEGAFTARAGLYDPVGGALVQFRIMHEDGTTATQTEIANDTLITVLGNNQFECSSPYIEGDAGDKIWVEFLLPGPVGSGVLILSNSTSGIDTDITVDVSLKIVEGSVIEPTDYLPESLSQFWFIQQIGILYNMVFDTDPIRKQVKMVPWVDYYGTFGQSLDMTREVDQSQPFVNEFQDLNVNRFQIFQFSEDPKDAKVEYLEGLTDTGLNLHAYKEDLGEVYTPKESVLRSEFAPTAIKQETYGSIIVSGTAYAPQLWKELPEGGEYPERSYDFRPRIVKYDGQIGSVTWNYAETGNTVTGWPYARPVDYIATTDQNDSLAWEDIETSAGALLPGHYSRYYWEYLQQIIKGRIVKCEMHWSVENIARLDFSRVIQLDTPFGTMFYRLVALRNYNPGSAGTTTTILSLIVPVDPQPKKRPGFSGELPWGDLVGGVDSIPSITETFGDAPPFVPGVGPEPDDEEIVDLPGGTTEYDPRLAGPGPRSMVMPGGGSYARNRSGSLALGVGGWISHRGGISVGDYPEKDEDAVLNVGAGTAASRSSVFRVKLSPRGTSNGKPYVLAGANGSLIGGTEIRYFEVSYSDLTGLSGMSDVLKLADLYDGAVLLGWKLKIDTAFAGTNITAMTCRPIFNGETGGEKFTARDIFTAADTSQTGFFELAGNHASLPAQAANTDLELEVATTGGNLSALTAGELRVWVMVLNMV